MFYSCSQILLLFMMLNLSLKTFPISNQLRHISMRLHSGGSSIASEYLFGNKPILFKDTMIRSELVETLHSIRKTHATLIQSFTIPKFLNGNDIVISAETGSGKTLAYLLPLFQLCIEANIERTNLNFKPMYPTAVVLVPNKDLATQVVQVGKELSAGLLQSGLHVTIG
jgi:superfamily II DNA/RNA helicase